MNEQEIFFQVLQADDPAGRRVRLKEACGGDRGLEQRVEHLLEAHDRAGSFLEAPAAPLATINFSPIAEGPGAAIGPYKLLQQIGEGGFGVVFMAEQVEPVRRKVALKIIKPGMDTREVIARFESERQALALMDHPNIARVLDAGATASGRPYFVMELVKGLPITEFADKNRLTVEQRLPLFVDVCRAVQHAHQKGVIHRDLKPSNVMVTLHDGRPVAKVIDFGVAKATSQQLTQRTLFTAYGQMIGTPAYMSPEQAEMSGLDIDTRSDIYSLGVLLYELLTGTTPLELERLRAAGFAEMQRLIREEEAPRPSTRFSTLGEQATALASSRGTDAKRLGQFLRGDLDWIVMKSLEKDRNRRYETPGAFAADIERFLSHDAIDARPPSAGYRLRKFARRNAVALVIAAISFVGAMASTHFGLRARQQADRATAAERSARENLVEAQKNEASLASAKEHLRGTLYAAEMDLIQTNADAGQFYRAHLLLDRQQPQPGESDLRGWEWHYWRRRLAGGQLRSVKVAELERLAFEGTQELHFGALSFTRDGERVFAMIRPAADEYSKLMGFDAATGQPLSEVVLRNPPGADIIAANQIPAILSINQDGARFAYARETADQWQALVRDAKSGEPIAALKRVEGRRLASPLQTHVALSPDGKSVAQTHSNLHSFAQRLAENRDAPRQRPGPNVDPMGRPIGLPSTKVIVVDVTTGQEVVTLTPKANGAVRVLWSADSQRLLIQSHFLESSRSGMDSPSGPEEFTRYSHSQLVEIRSGNPAWERTDEERLGNSLAVQIRAWSSDGRFIAVSSDDTSANSPGSQLELWDAESGRTVARLALPIQSSNRNPQVAFGPESRMLAVGEGHEVHLWDLRRVADPPSETVDLGPPTVTLPNVHGAIRALAFSGDGREIRAVTGAAITTWEATLPEAREAPRLRPRSGMERISEGATRLAIVDFPERISICDATTGKFVRSLGGSYGMVGRLDFSHDGRMLAVGLMGPVAQGESYGLNRHHAKLHLFDADDGRALGSFDVGVNSFRTNADFHFHRDGRHLAMMDNSSQGNEGRARLRIWDLQQHVELPAVVMPWRTGRVLGCTADGVTWVIAQGNQGRQVILVDATTREVVATHDFPGRIGLFEPRHNLVGVAQDGDLVFYDLATRQEQVRLLGFPPRGMTAFSTDGRRLAIAESSAGASQSRVEIWSLDSGRRLLTLAGPRSVSALRFTSDGHRLLARGAGWPVDYPSHIWDATPLSEADTP